MIHMGKKLLVIILALVVVSSLGYVFLSKNKEPMNEASNARGSNMHTPNESGSSSATTSGSYMPYSSEALSQAKGAILLFFHASWCPQCREIEKTINESGVPDGVTVLKIDYDTNQALRQKYGVTLQTTFVKVNNLGEKLASYVAYNEPSFSAVKRELLP